MTETVRGELLDFRVVGSDFWGFGQLRTLHDGGVVKLTGKLLGANVGDTLEVEGVHATGKYGAEFKVRGCRVILPADAAGVVGWLAAKLPQISSRRAEQLVERFGVDGLWRVLDAGDVEPLCAVDGITPRRAGEILTAYLLHKGERDRFVQLRGWGLTDHQIAKVIERWGEHAEQQISDNPYRLIEEVKGFGWERADAVALRMGLRRDDPARLCAGLVHAMGIATQAGHCYAASGMLVSVAAKKICQVDDERALYAALDMLVSAGKLVRLEQHVYLPHIADAEGKLAQAFARRAAAKESAA
jgi:exodeoxyribonuclease V alpha subunit